MAKTPLKPRYVCIDIARTIAVVSMVLYHVLFCIRWFNIYTINLQAPQIILWQKATLGLFLLVSGASVSIANTTLKKGLERCIRLGLIALAITIITEFAVPNGPIYFGVLHCIALMQLVLVLPLQQWQWLLIAVITASLSPLVQSFHLQTSLLVPIGITPVHFTSLDYVPLIPWLSVAIIGRLIGNYVKHTQKPISYSSYQQLSTIPGRYALLIYIVHIPLIVALIQIFYRS